MSDHAHSQRFVVLLPVKPAAVAKSRLLPLGDPVRRELVVAFAADTTAAALGIDVVSAVVAVTDDSKIGDRLAAMGAEVIRDGAPDGDLNAALLHASQQVHRRWADTAVAAVCADLPALRPEELAQALDRASSADAAFVADTEGAGTTMLTAASTDLFAPRFGPQSRKAHLEAGVAELDSADLPGLRRDVDTPDDLRAAVRLGLGLHTARVVADLRL